MAEIRRHKVEMHVQHQRMLDDLHSVTMPERVMSRVAGGA